MSKSLSILFFSSASCEIRINFFYKLSWKGLKKPRIYLKPEGNLQCDVNVFWLGSLVVLGFFFFFFSFDLEGSENLNVLHLCLVAEMPRCLFTTGTSSSDRCPCLHSNQGRKISSKPLGRPKVIRDCLTFELTTRSSMSADPRIISR